MSGNSQIVYWDTSIFLAWLQDEERKPGEMDGVRDIIAKINKNEIRLITSVIFKTEILDSKMTGNAKEILSKTLKRRNVRPLSVDMRIADLSSEIRDHYQRQSEKDGKPTVSTPDAIHLATGILYQAEEFHTFDEQDRQHGRALLPLSGDVAGYNLNICKPEATQLGLDLKKS